MSKRQKRKIGWAVKPGMKITAAQRAAGWHRLALHKFLHAPLPPVTIDSLRHTLRETYIIPDSLVPALESLSPGIVYTASHP